MSQSQTKVVYMRTDIIGKNICISTKGKDWVSSAYKQGVVHSKQFGKSFI